MCGLPNPPAERAESGPATESKSASMRRLAEGCTHARTGRTQQSEPTQGSERTAPVAAGPPRAHGEAARSHPHPQLRTHAHKHRSRPHEEPRSCEPGSRSLRRSAPPPPPAPPRISLWLRAASAVGCGCCCLPAAAAPAPGAGRPFVLTARRARRAGCCGSGSLVGSANRSPAAALLIAPPFTRCRNTAPAGSASASTQASKQAGVSAPPQRSRHGGLCTRWSALGSCSFLHSGTPLLGLAAGIAQHACKKASSQLN